MSLFPRSVVQPNDLEVRMKLLEEIRNPYFDPGASPVLQHQFSAISSAICLAFLKEILSTVKDSSKGSQ